MGRYTTILTRPHLRLAACGALLAGLAACGGGGDGRASGIAGLGSVFQRAFSQEPNDRPIDIANAGLQVDLTAEPFEL